jgi:ABC-type Mn2+/Zn2+ transport system ATPase subunit
VVRGGHTCSRTNPCTFTRAAHRLIGQNGAGKTTLTARCWASFPTAAATITDGRVGTFPPAHVDVPQHLDFDKKCP